MADNLNILLRSKLDKSAGMIKELNTDISIIAKKIDKLKLKVDVEGFDVVNKKVDKVSKKLKARVTTKDSQFINPNVEKQAFDQLTARIRQIKQEVNELAKVDFVTGKKGIQTAKLTYWNEQLGKTVQETMGWSVAQEKVNEQTREIRTFETQHTRYTENIAKAKKALQRKEAAQKKVNAQESKYEKRVNSLIHAYNKKTVSHEHFIKKMVELRGQTDFNTLSWKKQEQAINLLHKAEDNYAKNTEANQNVQKRNLDVIAKKKQQLLLFQQKMLGGDGLRGEIDIFSSKHSLKSSQKTQLEQLKNDIKGLNHTSPELNKNLQTMQNRFSLIKQEASESGNVLTRTFENLTKFMRFYLVGGAFVRIIGQFRQGVEVVKELDSAITNMRITMNLSANEFDKMANHAQRLAKELGSTVSEVLGAAKTFANMNESIEAILEKTRANIILANLSGSGIEETVDSIQGIIHQFELLESDSMRIADSLTYISSNLAMDFSKGIREITDGIKTSGAMAREAGFELEQYQSLLGGVIESSRLPGSTVGTAFNLEAMVA